MKERQGTNGRWTISEREGQQVPERQGANKGGTVNKSER